MNFTELQDLYAQRFPDENINETMIRIEKNNISTGDISYDRELTIPRYKMIQPSCTLQDATAGYFKNMFTGEEVSKLENVVFLVQQNSRTMFPKNDFSGSKRCYSLNGYYPSPDVKKRTGNEPLAKQCAIREDGKIRYLCPFAEWRNELGEIDSKGSCPPQCKPTISFLGVDSDYMPFWTTFHSSALVEIKKFLQFVKYKKELFKRKGEKLELYHFPVTISLELITNSRGKYYLPKIATEEIIMDAQKKIILTQCYEDLKDRFLSDPIDSPEEK